MAKGERPGAPLQTGEPQKLLEACKNARERALIVLLWRGGLRVAEACALAGSDVELDEGDGSSSVRIRRGKGSKQRFVGLDPVATGIVWPLVNGGPVLVTETGRHMFPTQARRILKRLGQVAKVEPDRAHPHALRHSCAKNLHDEGYSVREIQVWLGHERLETTGKYLSSIGCNEVVAKARKREW